MPETSIYPAVKRFLEPAGFEVKGCVDKETLVVATAPTDSHSAADSHREPICGWGAAMGRSPN
jgi:hypothetical protein